jgi:hypothetical protein
MSDSPQLRGVREALEYFLELFTVWFHASVHPVANCKRLLSVTNERERIHQALRLWGTSFTVALAIDLPLYHFYGIEWSNVGFEVSSSARLCANCRSFDSLRSLRMTNKRDGCAFGTISDNCRSFDSAPLRSASLRMTILWWAVDRA